LKVFYDRMIFPKGATIQVVSEADQILARGRGELVACERQAQALIAAGYAIDASA